MMIYRDNMITWKRTSNVCAIPKSGLTRLWWGITEKIKNITINNDDGETMPLWLEKNNDEL